MNTALQLDDGKLVLVKNAIPKVEDPHDVVIKVSFCGVCGTDLSIIAKTYPSADKIVMGHEFSGILTEVGSAVKHLNVGDRYDISCQGILKLCCSIKCDIKITF